MPLSSSASSGREATVVGSGPNGLAAAVVLARAGWRVRVLEEQDTIGGGARTTALTLPGFLHDRCSAIHPLAAASPFFESVDLAQHGLKWIHPPLALAHPFDDGTAAVLARDLDLTCEGLADDGKAWRQLFEPIVKGWRPLMEEVLQPMLHVPKHPWRLARFGLPAIAPALPLARWRFQGEAARALFCGLAAHSFLPLDAFASAAFGLVLGGAAHAVGWPMPSGGAQAISDALASVLTAAGGIMESGRPVRDIRELGQNGAVMLGLSAWSAARVAGPVLPAGYRRKLERFRHGPGVFKVDYALNSPIPWKAADCARAGTVHLGGKAVEVAQAEAEVAQGQIPARPFALVTQPSLFDVTRAPAGRHVAWAYCHIPYGCDADMTDVIEMQIERFAPGFRDSILARVAAGPRQIADANGNLEGGDISGGANDLWQLIARPVLKVNPYRMPVRGLYLCSSSTPPGGGVHGMCGYHAAMTVLRDSN